MNKLIWYSEATEEQRKEMAPMHVGDVYILLGYPCSDLAILGYAYQSLRDGRYRWQIELEDGDSYDLETMDALIEDAPLDDVALLRRGNEGLSALIEALVPEDIRRKLYHDVERVRREDDKASQGVSQTRTCRLTCRDRAPQG